VLKLVTIELSGADLEAFDSYEAAVLAVLPEHGGRLELRVRAMDASKETHLLYFPDEAAYERFRADPRRTAVQDQWRRSRATSSAIDVERLS